MKRLILSILFVCLLCIPARADVFDLGEKIKGAPNLKTGVAISIKDQEAKPAVSLELLRKWNVTFDAGWVGDDILAGFVGYDLDKALDWADIPLSKYIKPEIAFYYGVERINQGKGGGEDIGVVVKLIEVKF